MYTLHLLQLLGLQSFFIAKIICNYCVAFSLPSVNADHDSVTTPTPALRYVFPRCRVGA